MKKQIKKREQRKRNFQVVLNNPNKGENQNVDFQYKIIYLTQSWWWLKSHFKCYLYIHFLHSTLIFQDIYKCPRADFYPAFPMQLGIDLNMISNHPTLRIILHVTFVACIRSHYFFDSTLCWHCKVLARCWW